MLTITHHLLAQLNLKGQRDISKSRVKHQPFRQLLRSFKRYSGQAIKGARLLPAKGLFSLQVSNISVTR
jgi:hypothetical protein